MRKKKVPITRTVKGREIIINEIRDIMDNNGSQNYLISGFLTKTVEALSEEIQKKQKAYIKEHKPFQAQFLEDEPITKLISHPIPPKGKPFVCSYKIVINYLELHNMKNTLSAINEEIKTSFQLTNEKIKNHQIPKYKKLMNGTPQFFFSKILSGREIIPLDSSSTSSVASTTSSDVQKYLSDDRGYFPDRNYFPLFDAFSGI